MAIPRAMDHRSCNLQIPRESIGILSRYSSDIPEDGSFALWYLHGLIIALGDYR